MSMHDLELATRPQRRGTDTFDLDIPDGWQQGRGAYGGLPIASLVRAIEQFSDTPDRTLRSFSAELPGPTLVGPAEVRVETIRAGSGQSTLSARLVQGGETRAFAVAVLARPRAPAAATFCELEPPVLRPYRDIPALPGGPFFPVFAQHFEYRTDGPFPFTAGKEARIEGWIKPRHVGSLSCGAHLAAVADAWWPATYSRASAPFLVGTVAYTLQIVGAAEPLDPDAPFAYRARVWVQSEGWFVEQRELWSEDGHLLALNQQTFAIIK
ncbi:thioesterase family protein [Chondromyces apiculatus]|uniref:TesB-like acyl-CoA thioesterase 1 n=1 Tax=Chondromyces apiculatus DSM 436 TaxID=1192034 RepID=A0A017T968_9BACT|nr:thioesterase family protein [Chondromyces apiculatus]EYF05818.1 TesB-like acyl-CoA thioesterase 1 [Chondromyces apiculatus DSM 436]